VVRAGPSSLTGSGWTDEIRDGTSRFRVRPFEGRALIGVVTVLLAMAVLVWPRSPDLAGRLAVLGRVGRVSQVGRVREVSRVGQVGRVGRTRPEQGPRGRFGGGGAVSVAVARVRRRRRYRSPRDVDREVLPLLEGLAATLRAGLTPARALAHLAEPGEPVGLPGLVSRLAAQASTGARLEPVWRTAAETSGSTALLAVAEGWRLSERHGAPIVEVLDALTLGLRDQSRTAAAVAPALAAPRASATLLGVLPLGGVVLAELVGVHPVSVLVGSPAGRVAAVAGLGATLGGRLWMRRLVTAASRG
jgi:tight adherence protein B